VEKFKKAKPEVFFRWLEMTIRSIQRKQKGTI